MKPLSRTVSEAVGEVLHSPWPALDEFVDVREGDAITVLGAPMSNKSNLMLNWIIRNRIPAIYGSFDTPLVDMTARSLSILSGDKIDTVLEHMRKGAYDEYADSQMHLWFTDRSDCLVPDRDGLTLLDSLSMAYEEFLGEPPKVIVLDNLSDTAESLDHVHLQAAFKMARDVGRRLNCAVFALHHVKRSGEKGGEKADPSTVPIKLNDGVGAGERDAAVVLGLWKPRYGDSQVLRIAHLKSKRKEANPAGGLFKDFELDQARAWIGEEVHV